MSLSKTFQHRRDKTIQLELSGGGAHGAYEGGALEALLPFWQAKGFKLDTVTGVSAGAVNAALLTYALNSGQADHAAEIMRGFWRDVAKTGDAYLSPLLDMHRLTNTFNLFARPEDSFPNIPRYMMAGMELGGKSSLPLQTLKHLLDKHIPPEAWQDIREGDTEMVIGSLKVDEKAGLRSPVRFAGEALSVSTVLASAALRDFAPYRVNGELYEDGGYDKIGFFMEDRKTDVLFAIGLKPLRNVAEMEDHRGVKTGQLHHDLARFYLDPARRTHIDFLCMDHPAHWNETSSMNNTSRNINSLYDMGKRDALAWIEANGAGFGKQSSFRPSDALLRQVAPAEPIAA